MSDEANWQDEKAAAERSLDWIDAESDKWAVECGMHSIVEQMSTIANLTKNGPQKERDALIGRWKENALAMFQQTFVEAWLRCHESYKEYRDAVEAARIRLLEQQLKTAQEALEPFAKEASRYDPPEGDNDLKAWSSQFTIGQLRRAAAAIRSLGEKE